jgi:hypothetical protein
MVPARPATQLTDARADDADAYILNLEWCGEPGSVAKARAAAALRSFQQKSTPRAVRRPRSAIGTHSAIALRAECQPRLGRRILDPAVVIAVGADEGQ